MADADVDADLQLKSNEIRAKFVLKHLKSAACQQYRVVHGRRLCVAIFDCCNPLHRDAPPTKTRRSIRSLERKNDCPLTPLTMDWTMVFSSLSCGTGSSLFTEISNKDS
jgi:hypothetical protein